MAAFCGSLVTSRGTSPVERQQPSPPAGVYPPTEELSLWGGLHRSRCHRRRVCADENERVCRELLVREFCLSGVFVVKNATSCPFTASSYNVLE